jgi:hypothetical protein
MNAYDYYVRGKASYDSGNYQAALTDFNQCLTLRGSNPEADDYYLLLSCFTY